MPSSTSSKSSQIVVFWGIVLGKKSIDVAWLVAASVELWNDRHVRDEQVHQFRWYVIKLRIHDLGAVGN